MTYLQHGPPPLPIIDQGQSPQNTRNDSYRADDINNVGHWAGFNLASIQQQFGPLLTAAGIPDEPFQPSPPRPINSEAAVRSRIDVYLTSRIVRALCCGFSHLQSTQQLANLIIVKYDILILKTRPNRVLGDAKPLFKWSSGLRNHPNPINYYMKQHHARYGYIITDRELVAIRRLDEDGNLELSTPISWIAKGTASELRLTVLLGIWYLGILAANNQVWYLHRLHIWKVDGV
ncbi:uncharacterized protein BO80DRAFT_455362 [Aspergillus ibericus CBS 121593]|uniref:Uncharacterized protein n=1 Tax=Aspergillus ibericus CBS 121593 TaxID=1448316 RepID=A0A395H0K3_9EURO|nr:hypothetical protein BO80DRAFT_455362 [Aspergillus ibericus CBS 121593]RAL00835.1 hypothetical protein BO80DRAFT_455362 [Aspergillus ibericus CBS 121593]